MKRISVISIRVGDAFDQPLFLASGQKLIPAGEKITKRHVEVLRRQSAADAYITSAFDRALIDSAATYGDETSPDSAATQADATCSSDRPDESDAVAWRKERVAQCNAIVDRHLDANAGRPQRIHPHEIEVWDAARLPDVPWPEPGELDGVRSAAVAQIDGLYTRMGNGQTVTFDQFVAIVQPFERLLLAHRERFTQLSLLVKRHDEYLPDHALSACLFAMATAAQLTWGIEHVRLAGTAALLHDVGMLLVPKRIRYGGEQLSSTDRGRVQRHTAYSLAMLESVDELPPAVAVAAYQHHERENGTGYPRQLKEDEISDLSRVVAVADVFSALSSPRNYRRHRLPYTAMEQLVRAAGSNQFYKPAARALVQAAGLFPVGSYVMLSDGRRARVMAANPNHLDRPTIVIVDEAGDATSESIDLSKLPKGKLAVERPVESPAGHLEAA